MRLAMTSQALQQTETKPIRSINDKLAEVLKKNLPIYLYFRCQKKITKQLVISDPNII